jgi:hypothetical protein
MFIRMFQKRQVFTLSEFCCMQESYTNLIVITYENYMLSMPILCHLESACDQSLEKDTSLYFSLYIMKQIVLGVALFCNSHKRFSLQFDVN